MKAVLATFLVISTCTCSTHAAVFVSYGAAPSNDERSHNETVLDHEVSRAVIYDVESDKGCYPWMFRNKTSGICECSSIPNRAVLCDPTIPRTYILDCYCMTYDADRNETELGHCVYGCGHKVDTVYYKLPSNKSDLNSYTCGKTNRDSTLCGRCKPGYSPLVYSYDMKCMNCTGMTNNWIKYVAVAYIPLTFFFVFVIIFRFSGMSPLVRSMIAICQGIVSPLAMRAYLTVLSKKPFIELVFRVVGTIYGVFNLDFFRLAIPPLCLDITPIQALSLDYAIAFYPLLLVFATYILISLHSRDYRIVVWLWKPFHKVFRSQKKDWDLKGSVVKAFSTFFLLSYLKILNVTFDLLVYTKKYVLPLGEQSYRVKHALYYDASVEYFRGSHLYYGIIAIVVGLLIVILPLVFLVVYPMSCFQKCLNSCKIQRQGIDMFVNCYQGYYKDGTNGTRDYRCFSITFFLLQLIVYALFTLSPSIYCFSLGALITQLFLFTIVMVRPYKEQFKAYNKIDTMMLLILSASFIMICAGDEADIKAPSFSSVSYTVIAFLALVPLVYLIILSVWWVVVNRKLKCKLCCCFQKKESTIEQLSECCDNSDFCDRIENPSTYENQAAPLIAAQKHSTHHDVKYGSVNT